MDGRAFSRVASIGSLEAVQQPSIHYQSARRGIDVGGASESLDQSCRTIRQRHRDSKEAIVAMITHGDVIRALLVLLLGMPLDHVHRDWRLAPASVSEYC